MLHAILLMNFLNRMIQGFSRWVGKGLVLLSLLTSASAQQEWDIYLLGGQSNAEGRALNSGLPRSLRDLQSDVMFFNGVGGSWGDLGPGTGGNSATGGDSSQFGPELSLGRTLADDHPTRNIAIVKYGAGGTNLHTQWDPDDAGADNEYDRFLRTVNNAITALPAGDTYTLKGMLWMQGENDAPATGGNSVSANSVAYEANLTNFISRVREDLGESELTFVIGQIGHLKDVPNSSANWTIVQNAQARTAALDDHAQMVVNTDLPLKDLVHYNAAGQETLGENFAKALQGRIDQLQINNGSFEIAAFGNNDDGDQADNLDSTLISGWSESGVSGSAAKQDETGTMNLDSGVYSNAATLDIDGSNVLSIVGDIALEQSLSAVAVIGKTYTLTAAIGDRDVGLYQDFAGARVELLSDGQVLADSGEILSGDVVDGAFTDISFSYTVESDDNFGVLGIRLVSLNENAGSSSVDFDNVRITSVSELKITKFNQVSGNSIEVTWTSVPWETYAIDISWDLVNWSEFVPEIEGAISPVVTTSYLMSLPPPEVPRLFYRVRVK